MISTNSQKCKFELVTSSSLEGQSETTETTVVKTKMEWTKCIFFQNDKLEKNITPTEPNKQGTITNTFQRIENGQTFVDTCILNHAKFHKTCRNSFHNYHFEQLKKNPTNVCKTTDNNKKIATQLSFSSLNFQLTCMLRGLLV